MIDQTRRLPLPALLVAGLLLAGCAGSPPVQDHDYLLRPQKLTVTSGSRSVVQLKPVVVAPYLDQKGMVLQTGSSEIQVARHHRWAEPLDEAVERYLQVSIANQAGVAVESVPLTTLEEDATVTIRINQLHGTKSGRVRLVADWKVDRADLEPMLYSFDESVTQATDGYPALVDAHAELLDRLGGAIARSLESQQ
ncbi:MAG: membrane integrity-associated transporter subunit PqiC [Gammaproteobacteria bacterium]|nr:MAG: membrane integrity-associated transporter subunit PqiC [Gammaproteobacteria bacterium]